MTLSNVQQAAGSNCGNLPFGVLSATEVDCTTKCATKEAFLEPSEDTHVSVAHGMYQSPQGSFLLA